MSSSTTLDFDYISDDLGRFGSLVVVDDASEANQHTFVGGAYKDSTYGKVPAIFHFKDKTA